ncbi:ABC transporter ATP-binding protein [Kutzneria buriramensis]|uniref:Peptide/nickel transport system ATP-binding protein n=1 Tax=Kutzneria buriramensis TaxID=1045776 RepID=A0A3E0GYQ1_9PSEU|nr:ABC transporter ATP-binding protein [Kutzneria buriramensis]REH35249.1 peptide/nickel transport system ATP-binding protein [Kutzneria buriramensis]
MSESVVSVRDLVIDFHTEGDTVRAVDGLSFDLAAGRALGIVGESGSGKSATALSLLGLHRGGNADVTGSIDVLGTDVLAASNEQVRQLRGNRIAMVFQDPLSALDPFFKVGDQIVEAYRAHNKVDRRAARKRAIEVLDRVGIPDAARRVDAYPHEFSGGMRQRALIAMALALSPEVLVADEPTTALDVTVQAQILDLIHDLRAETGMALILVTHDLAVAAGNVDDVLVMQRGKAVEHGPAADVLGAPSAVYTRELVAAVPRLEQPRESKVVGGEPLVRVDDVHQVFTVGSFLNRTKVHAVEGVTLDVLRGEALGIVGESGSGKTTLARMIVRLLRPTSGRIRFDGRDLADDRALREVRRELQMVFQDPVSSLNPRRTIGESIADPLRVQGEDASRQRVRELLALVGLDPDRIDRYPHEFSGGQRQRIGIARAIGLRPRLLVCDEPVSALDVSTQAQIIRLLASLRSEFDLTLIFVAHDLAVVRQVSDRVAVMSKGAVVELGETDALYDNPTHPYTKSLLAAVPVLDPELARQRRLERGLLTP